MSHSSHPSALRIGIIGAGANTRLRHIPGLRACDGVELAVVCNRTPASSQKAAEDLAIPRWAEHWMDVVSDSSIDAICIGTWPYLHAPITLEALARGKHVLTEARMAMDLEEAVAMEAASTAHSDLVAQIVPAPMSLDLDASIQEILRSGRLGQLREVCITHTHGGLADASGPMSWRLNSHLSGHNMLTLGIYYEMVRRWLPIDPEWVMADAAIFTPHRLEPGNPTPARVDLPESLTVAGRYADGIRLIAHFSGVESTAPRDEVRLNGSEGCLRVDLKGNRLFLALRSGSETEIVVPQDQRRGWRVEADFISSIRERTPVRLTDFSSGVAYMRFTDAVFHSWQNDGRKTFLAGHPTSGDTVP